jgi:hypothetical protein
VVTNAFTADAFPRARFITAVAEAEVLIFVTFHEFFLLFYPVL